jgi:serine/threonine-protein kinase
MIKHFEGETLAGRLARTGALSPDDVVDIGVRVAQALETLHRRGGVCGHLRPDTIRLQAAGVELLGVDGAGEAAVSGVSLEPDYQAPEQLDGQAADARSDHFALGCVLYEMVAGRRPFGADTRDGIIGAIRAGGPPAISALAPMTPPSLDRLIMTCLATDPDDRWQSARDLGRELGRVGTLDEPASERMEDESLASPGRLYGVIGLAAGFVLAAALRACGS